MTALLVACSDEPPPAAMATAPPAVTAAATPSPPPPTLPSPQATASAARVESTPVAKATPRPAVAPTSGRWIDVDVTRFTVKLMDGKQVVREIGPVGVGAQIDTGVYESTQTGLFHVYNKTAGLTYDAPYDTYIDWWVGFDPDKANGFHSFLLDAKGNVVNAATGRISNGCIRTHDPKAVFEFAEVGMPVFVHA
ncbi:MAG: murein L,D-transpeptidase [Dehalococcoidia bacterium]|nr:MAG: murein L,D-transpeptidase [Dehalococcoidia bacterium]